MKAWLAVFGLILALGVVGVILDALSQVPPLVVVLALAASLGAAVYAVGRRGAGALPSRLDPAPLRAQGPSPERPAPPRPPPPAWAAQEPPPYGKPRTVPTLRGEKVASRGEARIADFLHRHGYDYRYEATVCGFRPDFYLPQMNLIIELWGTDPPGSEKRRIKTAAYLSSGFRLIGLEASDWPRLEEELKRRLYRYDKDVYRRTPLA